MCARTDPDNVWHLTISTYRGLSYGARHYYGRLHQPNRPGRMTYPMSEQDQARYGMVDVVRPVTPELARELSLVDEVEWEPVGTTNRFDSREDVISAALEQWRELPSRQGIVRARLVLGNPAYLDEDCERLDELVPA